MNPDWLLKHFEQISEAPDAIPRLRRFILNLAVRGKLAKQNPEDEPASKLLKRIRAEKQEHAGRRSCAEQRPFEVDETETPFEIPESWEWVQATEPAIVISDKGKKVQTKDVLEFGEFPVVDQGKVLIRGYCSDVQKVIRVSGPIIVFGDHTRETKLIDFDFVVGADGVKLLKPIEIDPAYYFLALQWVPLDSRGYARHFKLLRASRFPLPPLAEQHRIVAKVNELMALADELEATQAKRERRRDQLVAATLHGLNNGNDSSEPGGHPTFEENARFYFNHLPHLTTRPEHIHQLRQTILNLAVCGKLVPQDPGEVDRGLGYSGHPESDTRKISARLDPDHCLFDLPASWNWHRLEELATQVTDGEHVTPQRIMERQVPLVTAKNVRDGQMDYTNTDWVSYETATRAWQRCRPQVGDILLVCVGATTGRLCVIRDSKDMVLVRSVALIRPNNTISADFFAVVLRSPICQMQIWDKVKVTAQPCLYINRIKSLVIPRPPLAEQHRIVAKVNELTALCDELEARLTTTATTRRQLLEATLHEALKQLSLHEVSYEN